ncbi:MAG: adenylate/guanylate cyclase domain-containing protein [Alphaproteobacteria bacterium]|nr:adenylate/guanylate cyclase domain-containing protein [Alphaproteobacteria bacterium]
MTATATTAPAIATGGILHRYYLAMAVPFAIDALTSVAYVLVNGHPHVLLPMIAMSALFLVLGVGTGAWLLIRPVEAFLEQRASFPEIEPRLAHLPRISAALVACLYAPMLALRLLSPRLGITFGGTIDVTAWIDTVASFLVVTSFNVVLTYFVVSSYLDGLCEFLFKTRGVNLATFPGAFRRKIGIAILFSGFAAMILLTGDILSYREHPNRLLREASMDIIASAIGVAIVYYWITQALTHPIARLDYGMRHVAEGDLDVRLPVTSADEVGRATAGFNQMVDGLAERAYLRDTFGKYVHESVAAEILKDQDKAGRVEDTLAEATLMFTDIEGFTTLSERLAPAEVAAILNLYYGAVVPVIHRHGGVVNNCIGDGLFASFNLPLAQKGHAAAALKAALEIQQALAGVTFRTPIRTRIGINTGPVIGVTIGTANWLSYTLLGDAVNVASRVEQLNKQFGSTILASESTVQAAGPGFRTTCLGAQDMRGHRGDVVVYRVDSVA